MDLLNILGLSMKKLFVGLIILLFGVMLSGCSKLTQLTLSEDEINTYLQKHDGFQKQIGVSGLVNANVTLHDVSIQIGRTEPGKVTLTGVAKVDINSILGAQNATLNLTLMAHPFFDKESGAIYMKELEITDYTIQPEKMQTLLTPLTPYLNQALKTYFNERPVYVLNPENRKVEALAKKLAKGIEVETGKLVIPFTD